MYVYIYIHDIYIYIPNCVFRAMRLATTFDHLNWINWLVVNRGWWKTELVQVGAWFFQVFIRKCFRTAGVTHDPLHSRRTAPKACGYPRLACWQEKSARELFLKPLRRLTSLGFNFHHHCNVSRRNSKILEVCDFGDFCDCDRLWLLTPWNPTPGALPTWDVSTALLGSVFLSVPACILQSLELK